MSGHSEDAVLDFIIQFLADRESGRERPLAEYLAQYPHHELELARQFVALRDAPTAAEASTVSEGGSVGDAGVAIGPYRLVAELGRGAQGRVHLATDTRLGRNVALKILEKGTAGAPDVLARFRREAAIASRLDHPGLCPVYDAGRDGEVSWIAMRLVEGQNLAAALRTLPAGRERTRQVATWVEEAARALHAAHAAGIVHRDVKPSNIMVDRDGRIVILDFGLARATEDDLALTATGDALGTPAYMAPEQVRGQTTRIDARTDVWSLGVVLYEGLSGKRPFEAPTRVAHARSILDDEPVPLRTVDPAIPRDLACIAGVALEKTASRRYQSAAHLADDLKRFLAREPIAARPAGPLQRLARWAARRPALAASLAALLLSLGSGLGVALHLLGLAADRLDRFLQTADLHDGRGLLAEASRLPGTRPEQVAGLEDWLRRAESVVRRIPNNEKAASDLETGRATGGFGDRDAAWLGSLLTDAVARAREVETLLPVMRERLGRARTIVDRSLRAHADAWRACRERVRANSDYRGLEIIPQVGLVPLREDENTGLYSFWCLESGEAPEWSERHRRFKIGEATGVVLVLLPGGSFEMGAPNTEAQSEIDESPIQRITLDPYFIALHETTQGQWLRVMGQNPSQYQPGERVGRHQGDPVDLSYPVDRVSIEDALTFANLLGLDLPTEAQWEYAARAGTQTPWSFGATTADLAAHANVAIAGRLAPGTTRMTNEDGYQGPLSVGSLRANPFGLHDVHGNVLEWVRDRHLLYSEAPARAGDGLRPPPPGPTRRPWVVRGGGFRSVPLAARSANRNSTPGGRGIEEVGLRLARALELHAPKLESRR